MVKSRVNFDDGNRNRRPSRDDRRSSNDRGQSRTPSPPPNRQMRFSLIDKLFPKKHERTSSRSTPNTPQAGDTGGGDGSDSVIGPDDDDHPERFLISSGGFVRNRFYDYVPGRRAGIPRYVQPPHHGRYPHPIVSGSDTDVPSNQTLRDYWSMESSLGHGTSIPSDTHTGSSTRRFTHQRSSLPEIPSTRSQVSSIRSSQRRRPIALPYETSSPKSIPQPTVSSSQPFSVRPRQSLPALNRKSTESNLALQRSQFQSSRRSVDNLHTYSHSSVSSTPFTPPLQRLYEWSDHNMETSPKRSLVIEPRSTYSLPKSPSRKASSSESEVYGTSQFYEDTFEDGNGSEEDGHSHREDSNWPNNDVQLNESESELETKSRPLTKKIRQPAPDIIEKTEPVIPIIHKVKFRRKTIRERYDDIQPRYIRSPMFWESKVEGPHGDMVSAWPPQPPKNPATDYLLANALRILRQPKKVPIAKFQDATGRISNWSNSGYARNYIFKPDFGKIPEYLKRKQKPRKINNDSQVAQVLRMCRV